MNKRVREVFDSWDLKSLFLTILFLSIGFVVYFYFKDIRDRFRTSFEEKYKGQTQGEIIDVQKTDRITQSKWTEAKIVVDNYRVSYRYEVNGKKFESVDVIAVTPKNYNLLKDILKRGSNNDCSVRFDIQDPKKSLLVGWWQWRFNER